MKTYNEISGKISECMDYAHDGLKVTDCEDYTWMDEQDLAEYWYGVCDALMWVIGIKEHGAKEI